MKFNKLIPELGVKNIDKSLNFYIKILGFKVEYQRSEDKFAFLSFNGMQIMVEEIMKNKKSQKKSLYYVGKLEYPLGRGINFQISVKNIDPLVATLEKNKYPLKMRPRVDWHRKDEVLLGYKSFLVMDPDGYLLRFCQDFGKKKMRELKFREHDPHSKEYFLKERDYLLKRIDRKKLVDIFHFGSTAIPGIRGKGYIDMFMVLKNKKDLPGMLRQIDENTDYINPKKGGSKERVFRWTDRNFVGKNIMFHLHTSWKSGKEWKNDLLITKYLGEHPEVAKRYEELKYTWANKSNWDRRKYRTMKGRFMASVLRRAKQEKNK